MADPREATGLGKTTRVSACFGLNEIVANTEANDRALQAGDLFGIDVSARKDGWSGDTRKSRIVGGDASPLVTSLYSVSQQVMWREVARLAVWREDCVGWPSPPSRNAST